MALDRRWGALAIAALVGAAGFALFVVLTGAAPQVVAFEPFRVSAIATRVGLADVMSLGRSLGCNALVVDLGGLACVLLGVAVLGRRRRERDPFTTFALLCQLSLFGLFHHLYDYVLLAPLFACALRFAPALRALTLGYVGFFWFAVHFVDASPAIKTPVAIAAMALLSAAVFTTVAVATRRAAT